MWIPDLLNRRTPEGSCWSSAEVSGCPGAELTTGCAEHSAANNATITNMTKSFMITFVTTRLLGEECNGIRFQVQSIYTSSLSGQNLTRVPHIVLMSLILFFLFVPHDLINICPICIINIVDWCHLSTAWHSYHCRWRTEFIIGIVLHQSRIK